MCEEEQSLMDLAAAAAAAPGHARPRCATAPKRTTELK